MLRREEWRGNWRGACCCRTVQVYLIAQPSRKWRISRRSLRLYLPADVVQTSPRRLTPCLDFCPTFAAFRQAKIHCRVTSFVASFTATGGCGREGRVAKHPCAYAPGPKPLNARMRKPYLVPGQRPRTQNCVAFVRPWGAGRARDVRSATGEKVHFAACTFVYLTSFGRFGTDFEIRGNRNMQQ